MNKIFCPHCGSKSEYSTSPPSFCGSCRGDMQSLSNPAPVSRSEASVRPPKSRFKSRQAAEDEDDFESTDEVSSLDLDDIIESMSNRETVVAKVSTDFCTMEKIQKPLGDE